MYLSLTFQEISAIVHVFPVLLGRFWMVGAQGHKFFEHSFTIGDRWYF